MLCHYKITFRTEWKVDKLSFWPNCASSDKSTKVGKGRFACFELIRCGAAVGASPMSKCDEKLKGRTYFISEPKWPRMTLQCTVYTREVQKMLSPTIIRRLC